MYGRDKFPRVGPADVPSREAGRGGPILDLGSGGRSRPPKRPTIGSDPPTPAEDPRLRPPLWLKAPARGRGVGDQAAATATLVWAARTISPVAVTSDCPVSPCRDAVAVHPEQRRPGGRHYGHFRHACGAAHRIAVEAPQDESRGVVPEIWWIHGGVPGGEGNRTFPTLPVVQHPFRPEGVPALRRSVAMLGSHEPAGLDRETLAKRPVRESKILAPTRQPLTPCPTSTVVSLKDPSSSVQPRRRSARRTVMASIRGILKHTDVGNGL